MFVVLHALQFIIGELMICYQKMSNSTDPIFNSMFGEPLFVKAPNCKVCGSKRGVKPSVHLRNGPYYCIECCNYIDKEGKLTLS